VLDVDDVAALRKSAPQDVGQRRVVFGDENLHARIIRPNA
jgi:hypothetical protein